MKHYVTGYKPNKDEQVFKVRIPLSLSELRGIMQWTDDGDCVFDNEMSELHRQKIENACSIDLPKNLDLFLTTESS